LERSSRWTADAAAAAAAAAAVAEQLSCPAGIHNGWREREKRERNMKFDELREK
jgi:hypothetical protein